MGQAQPNLSDQRDRESQYDEFVALLSFHDRAIRRFIRSLLPSSDAVDDVVQETALECWKKYPDFQSLERSRSGDCDRGTEFVRWAFVIARFKVLSHQRDKARERLVFRDSVIAKLAETADLVAERESDERQAIENCLQKLPEDQRRLVLSIHTPGQSMRAIAAETGEQARKLYSKANAVRKVLLKCVTQTLATEIQSG